MTGRLAHIVRHPIKSIGWEEMTSAVLTAGEVLPLDRHWAVAHEGAEFGDVPAGWHSKQNFVVGVAAPQLMAVRVCTLEEGHRLRLSHHQRPDLEIAPDAPQASALLGDWLAPLWPASRPAPARLVSAGAQAMTDVREPFVSLLSLASLRALGEMLGKDLSIHRFRGNLWFDGIAPWAEREWIGRDVSIGPVRLRIERPITRCNATKADPATGMPDADTLGALQTAFGNKQFGLYATVIAGGELRPGDEVTAG